MCRCGSIGMFFGATVPSTGIQFGPATAVLGEDCGFWRILSLISFNWCAFSLSVRNIGARGGRQCDGANHMVTLPAALPLSPPLSFSLELTNLPPEPRAEEPEGRSRQKSSKSSSNSSPSYNSGSQQPLRWRAHVAADSYIALCSNITFPSIQLSPYGFTNGSYPLER